MRLIDYSNELKKNGDSLLRKEYHKRCFELIDSVNGEKEKLKEIALQEGVNVDTIKKHAREYYKTYIEKDENAVRWEELYISYSPYKSNDGTIKETAVNSLYLKLMQEEEPKKIIELIKNAEVDIYYLRNNINNFVVVYFPEQFDYLTAILRKKTGIYLEYKRNNKKLLKQEEKKLIVEENKNNDEELFKNSKWLLEDFIIGDYENRQQCCEVNKVDINFFDKLVDLAESYDIDLFQKYKEVIINREKKNYAIIVDALKRLVFYLENGIKEENNTVREFDIIDYYLLIKLDFEGVLKVINNLNLTVNQLRLVKSFIAKNKNNVKEKSNDVHQILNPNNQHIIGGRIIELSEKELVLNFLKINKIPKNSFTYSVALRRYLKNNLPIDEKEKKL